MKRILLAALLMSAVIAAVVRAQGTQPLAERPFVPVTDAMLAKPEAGDWLMWRRTLDSWGYSPLDQISRNNVAQLKQVWSHEMGPGRAEATRSCTAG
jgi:alcohol dehydrogenase (cytochrome c)